ncbi:hypothetical protein HOLleu_23517 [Holothuria leucospilota]|uniref:NADH-ubiquinone oxidoreductase 15 kDa subunit n=1 Tax=Holothuria leucospilota TaxID=206669 RepID=A0A9Q1BUB1_HOLLE|nr:hypothetical protein HOLleu_23517 [Holothuria leucospilota]
MVREWLPELWFEKPFLQNIKPLKPGLPVPKCANFEKDFYKCAEGIGQKRAQTECRLQIEDLKECASGSKHASLFTTLDFSFCFALLTRKLRK